MESMLYTKLQDSIVQCHVCEHHCVIQDGDTGICGVRRNESGTLFVENYPKSISVSIDPIRKKPLYHYLPHTNTYSFAAMGCNLHCQWCQNYTISQYPTLMKKTIGEKTLPSDHVEQAIYYGCPSISYTYSEPTIYVEYALETMKLAHEKGLKNIWVTNGYMSKQTLDEILPYLDAANVDIKAYSQEVYNQFMGGQVEPILRNIKTMVDTGVHVEITTLIIPGINDSDSELKRIVYNLVQTIGNDFVWHISKFFPSYQMKHVSPTPMATLQKAKAIGTSYGIKHIYLGNV